MGWLEELVETGVIGETSGIFDERWRRNGSSISWTALAASDDVCLRDSWTGGMYHSHHSSFLVADDAPTVRIFRRLCRAFVDGLLVGVLFVFLGGVLWMGRE